MCINYGHSWGVAGGTVSLAFAWGGAELGTLCVWMLSLTSNGEAFMPSGAGIAFTDASVEVDADGFAAALGGNSMCRAVGWGWPRQI